jgi:UDP-glucose 4-epimerase
MGIRVLVTGGAGFIGSHLTERLLAEPDVEMVRVVDNLSTGDLSNIATHLSRIEFIEADLRESSVCERAVIGINVIFHQAAIPSVARSVAKPLESHLHGSHLTLLLLESARQAGVRRIVFAGSSSCYGDGPELPKRETMPPSPCSPYAATKVACEQYMRAFANCYEMDAVTLRYFNVFGPRQSASSHYSGVIALFCDAYSRQQSLRIYGDGEQSRDFTFIDNVVHANLLAARHPGRMCGDVLNIGGGVRTSLNGLVDLMNSISGQTKKAIYEPGRVGDVRHSVASIERAREVLGYRPLVPLREGLRKTLDWYAERKPIKNFSKVEC